MSKILQCVYYYTLCDWCGSKQKFLQGKLGQILNSAVKSKMVLLPFSKYFHDSATTWKEISDKICLESLIIYFPQNYQIRWCRIRILNYKCSVALFHLCQRLTIKCFHVWNQILKWTHYGTTEAWNTPQMHDDGPYWCGSNLCVCTVLSILIAPCMLSLNGKYIMKNLLHILHFFSTNLWICQCPSSQKFLW